MHKTIAVTGVDGFVGRHLARKAAEKGAKVIGLSRAESIDQPITEYLDNYYSVDLRSEWPMGLDPDIVVHLAGRAAVGASFADPQGYITDNSAIVTTMCEALMGSQARIIGVSSGSIYSAKDENSVFDETSDTVSSSPYAISKLVNEHQLEYYRLRGLDTVVARPFNHIGPGQASGFLIPDLLTKLTQLTSGESLAVGNLATSRDYTDVRDIADAYLALALATHLEHSVYNVSSGVAISGEHMLKLLTQQLEIEMPRITFDQSLFRPTDAISIQGSSMRLRTELGWEPVIPLEQTIADIVSSHITNR